MRRSSRRSRTITLVAYIFIIVFLAMVRTDWRLTASDNYMAYVHEANVTSLTDKFIHKHEYRLSLNNASICDRDIFLVILVNTDPENRKAREIIRDTWGSVKMYNGTHIRVVFLIGERTSPKTGHADEIAARLNDESDTYGDIAKGDFIDAYANMTYKTVMGLHWMNIYCSKASFVMKIDDDVMINIYKLIHFLQEIDHTEPNLSNFFYGLTYIARPSRSNSSKWHVSYSDYKHEWYPTYCAGAGYILSNQAAVRMYQATRKVPFFWFDDVYMGFCAELSNIKPLQHYYGYHIIDKTYRDAPWEYSILKEVDREKQELSREAWAYIKTIKTFHNLTYYRILEISRTFLKAVTVVCLLVCVLAMGMRYIK